MGVLSAFMVVEANNAKAQEKKRCQYCEVRAWLTLHKLLSTGPEMAHLSGMLLTSGHLPHTYKLTIALYCPPAACLRQA